MTKTEIPDTSDNIIEELRKIKREHAKQFNFNVRAICDDLREEQSKSETPPVTLAPKKAKRKPAAA